MVDGRVGVFVLNGLPCVVPALTFFSCASGGQVLSRLDFMYESHAFGGVFFVRLRRTMARMPRAPSDPLPVSMTPIALGP